MICRHEAVALLHAHVQYLLPFLPAVMSSVLMGTGLPFLLARAGVDPANAGTSIQVCLNSSCRWTFTLITLSISWHDRW